MTESLTFLKLSFIRNAMLKELYMRNIAVIDEERLLFSKGFQVLTGETGAGKSILVETIGLILGQKASSTIIRDGKKEATAEAVFDIYSSGIIQTKLEEAGLINEEDRNELIVKRQIQIDGKNKVYVNHQRTSLAFLQSLMNHLIDFTGQLQQTQLLDSTNDIVILDSFLNDQNVVREYEFQFYKVKEIHDQIEQIKTRAVKREERLAWLKFQIQDFDDLMIKTEDEEADLKQLRERRKHGELVREFTLKSTHTLTEDKNSALNQIRRTKDLLDKNDVLKRLYGHFEPVLEDLLIKTEDLSYEISKAAHDNSLDAGLSLEEIEKRLHKVESLKRKYGPSLSDVLQKKTEIEEELANLSSSDEQIEVLKKSYRTELDELKGKADKLSEERHTAKKKIVRIIQEEMRTLQMSNACFEVDIQKSSGESFQYYQPKGLDKVTFLLSTNPGLSLRPLAKIASGGETSRIFLAIKKVLSHNRESGTYIFDEIDTGISGAAGELVGKKLRELAKVFQVFCVTHNPQVASQADDHYVVQKKSDKKTTITRINRLSRDERVMEIARLMGGVKITEKNLAYAKELMKTRNDL